MDTAVLYHQQLHIWGLMTSAADNNHKTVNIENNFYSLANIAKELQCSTLQYLPCLDTHNGSVVKFFCMAIVQYMMCVCQKCMSRMNW